MDNRDKRINSLINAMAKQTDAISNLVSQKFELEAEIYELRQRIMRKRTTKKCSIPNYLSVVPGGKESAPQDEATS